MTRRPLPLALALAFVLSSSPAPAHVGSPNVIFEGSAGPYPVRVIVRPPDVVPGLAEVSVRLLEGSAREVTLQPIFWFAPKDGGAPPPDRAEPVRGDPALFTGSLWLMTIGSYAVRVSVTGAPGQGEALVPVAALSAAPRKMQPVFGALLLALGLLLYAGSVSIVRASVGEAVIAPGEPTDTRRRRALVAAAIAAVLVGLVLFGLWRWWDAVDTAFRRRLYQPPRLVNAVRVAGGGRVVHVTIEDKGRRRSPLVPDHGKLMHLFLVREPAHDVLAHLHPTPTVATLQAFQAPLPPIPGGRFRVFADVTYESGFAETLTGSLELPEPLSAAGAAGGDPDDSFFVPPGKPDGFEIRREPMPSNALAAGRELTLRFRLVDAGGHPVVPEPYMGMAGHAVILRDDGSVFVHLHPSGTISMASQQRFGAKVALAGASGSEHAAHTGAAAAVLSFPYSFPREGRYRVFVQAKAAALVRTGVFDVTVAP